MRQRTEQRRSDDRTNATFFEEIGTPGASNRGDLAFVGRGLRLELEDTSSERTQHTNGCSSFGVVVRAHEQSSSGHDNLMCGLLSEPASKLQIVDLNALNAVLAVGRWKRYRGVFADLESEHNTMYVVDGNDILNEDQ